MAIKVSKKELSLFTTSFSLPFFIFFVFLTVLMMFMDSRYQYLKQIRKDFSFITAPLIILTNDSINFFANFQSLSKSKALLEEEINQLNIKVDNLSIENQIKNFLVAENDNLRKIALLSKKYSSKKTYPAQIIRPTMRGRAQIIIINKGKKDGIRQGMPVVNRLGLVGQIYSTYDHTSEVIPLLSKKFAVNALQDNGQNNAIIYGDTEFLVIPYFPSSIDVSPGDTFVTSGLDSVYPSGINIGKVVEVSPEDKQFNKILLKPATFSNQFSFITILDY
ncbi:rod shape-determining protein MreC [Methylophilaceae bacterium]|nr:rod shape-determining protein MreC [Methylophilaceae bacterium]